MNEIAHGLAQQLQDAHEHYIYWYRILRTSNDGLGLHIVTEQFSALMADTFAPEELYDIVPQDSPVHEQITSTLQNWERNGLQDVIIYRHRPMALCIDDWGQQYAVVYKEQAHCWPSLSDCFASIDHVIDYEIYHSQEDKA